MSEIKIVCPKVFPDLVWNEAEILGAMTWLWYQDTKRHKVIFEHVLGYLLPPIKHSQFVMFYENSNPIGFVSWAAMNSVAEHKYLHEKFVLIDCPDYWNSGSKIWGIDYFAPFGHYREIHNLLKNEIFSDFIWRTKSRREKKNGVPFFNTFRGKNVSNIDFKSWLEENKID